MANGLKVDPQIVDKMLKTEDSKNLITAVEPAAAQKLQLLTAAGHDRGLYYWTHPIPPFSFSFILPHLNLRFTKVHQPTYPRDVGIRL